MLEDKEQEGFFEDQSLPILLHRWNLEDRNIMVSQINGTWKITGIIDWDGAIALPRPLARIPPVWLWYWIEMEIDVPTSFYNFDHYKDPLLSEENKS